MRGDEEGTEDEDARAEGTADADGDEVEEG